QAAFVISEQNVAASTERPAVDEVEGVRWGLESNAAPDVQQILAWQKDMIAIPRFSGVEEDLPFDGDIGNVDGVKERNRRQAPLQVQVRQHEFGAQWAVAVVSMIEQRMCPQWILR